MAKEDNTEDKAVVTEDKTSTTDDKSGKDTTSSDTSSTKDTTSSTSSTTATTDTSDKKDIDVSNYGIFSDGISSVNALNTDVDTGITSLNSSKTKLINDSVFKGPICDSCAEGFTSSFRILDLMKTNLTITIDYLKQTSTDYNSSDSNAASKVLSMDATTGKLVTLGSIKGNNGKIIYYNQKGYYDENGNFHQWESSWGKDIASSGCGPTSMAACLANMLGDPSITPSTIANMMNYDDNIGGNYVIKTCQHYNLDQTHNIGLDKGKMDTFLSNGGTMIVAVNNGGHYISVLGINNDGSYIVCDPNNANTAQKRWTYNDISAGHTMVFHIAPPGKTVNQCLQEHGTAVQV